MQYIEQQNELIRSLHERMKSYEESAEDSISKEREVCEREFSTPSDLSCMCSSFYSLYLSLMSQPYSSSNFNGLSMTRPENLLS